MRKKLIVLVFLLVVSLPLFSDPLTGIWEIEWNDSKEQVISIMEQRGWKETDTLYRLNYKSILEPYDSKTTDVWFNIGFDGDEFLIFTKDEGTYGKLPVLFIAFDFLEGMLYQVRIFPSGSNSVSDKDTLHNAIMRKFKCTATGNYGEWLSEDNNIYRKLYAPDFDTYFTFRHEKYFDIFNDM